MLSATCVLEIVPTEKNLKVLFNKSVLVIAMFVIFVLFQELGFFFLLTRKGG